MILMLMAIMIINRETKSKITSIPIVTLTSKDNVNLTKQLNEGFKRYVY